jgi:hypothetical protein
MTAVRNLVRWCRFGGEKAAVNSETAVIDGGVANVMLQGVVLHTQLQGGCSIKLVYVWRNEKGCG